MLLTLLSCTFLYLVKVIILCVLLCILILEGFGDLANLICAVLVQLYYIAHSLVCQDVFHKKIHRKIKKDDKPEIEKIV